MTLTLGDFAMVDLEELRRLALAATPGPWEIVPSNGLQDEAYCYWHQVGPFDLMGYEIDEDDKFVAAANPQAVLELIKRIRALEAKIADISHRE
jgi:hypothetical protein